MTRRSLRGIVKALGATLLLFAPAPTAAQTATGSDRVGVAGDVTLLLDLLPAQDATEVRARGRLDLSGAVRDGRVRYRFEATGEGLWADRDRSTIRDGRVEARDVWVEFTGRRADVRLGFGRVVWGRLDEVAPSDVINPLDITRFLLEGRHEARRGVPFVRARVYFSEDVHVEAVAVPAFRRGTFDALDEPTSPFNLVRTQALPPIVVVTNRDIEHLEPASTPANLAGGGRLAATLGRIDVGVAAYRGHEAFGVLTFVPDLPASAPPLPIPGRLVERHTRFTMIAADFETVRGDWAIRGEAAMFVERAFAASSGLGVVHGKSLDAGVGFDRQAGPVRVFGTVLLHRQWSADDALVSRTDVSVVGSVERSFGRERWLARAFALTNPADRFGFLRALLTWRPVDNISIDASAGWFAGTSDDTIGRFSDRDFAFVRTVFFF